MHRVLQPEGGGEVGGATGDRRLGRARGAPPAWWRYSAPVSRSNSRRRSGSTPSDFLRDRRVGPDVGAVDPTTPGVGSEQAADHRERRGLAGAVGADDAEQRAGTHLEVDGVGRLGAAEGLAQVGDRERDVEGDRMRRRRRRSGTANRRGAQRRGASRCLSGGAPATRRFLDRRLLRPALPRPVPPRTDASSTDSSVPAGASTGGASTGGRVVDSRAVAGCGARPTSASTSAGARMRLLRSTVRSGRRGELLRRLRVRCPDRRRRSNHGGAGLRPGRRGGRSTARRRRPRRSRASRVRGDGRSDRIRLHESTVSTAVACETHQCG